MSTAAGWFGDPSSPGRLRYWDGTDWTDWVNEGGESRSDPLPPAPSATHADAAATPAEGWHDDPSSPGRLRYWDGGAWTDWVNENGETRSDPLPSTGASARGPGGPTATPEDYER